MSRGLSLKTLVLALVAQSLLATAQDQPLLLHRPETKPFHFVVYGDTRFTDPADAEAANPAVRRALVKAIAEDDPQFICFGGDIVYNGNREEDWKVYDSETKIWQDRHLEVYPALGNHDLHGDPKIALSNYFARYPELRQNRYYAVDAGPLLLLVLDSSLTETEGPQGDWIRNQLDHLAPAVRFVAILMHHPPYTSSSDAKKYGGGHSARSPEQSLAKMLEARQAHLGAKIVVFGGHVHNYERHEHGGVTYFVTGGGGAHAYPIERAPDDPFQSNEINYHYLSVSIGSDSLQIVMHRLQLEGGKAKWTEPDKVTLQSAAPVAAR